MDKNTLLKIDELDNLVVVILGGRNLGKSHTWNTMFGRTVKTGRRLKQLNIGGKRVDIFLVSGSPEERGIYIGDIVINIFLVSGSSEERGLYVDKLITVKNPRIVFCSIQDIPAAEQTFKYFSDRSYFMLIHWLNPGYKQNKKTDEVVKQLLNKLPQYSYILVEKDGNSDPEERVEEMKDFIYSWAKRKNLIS
ncbi:MAG: hypothetical protein ABSF13_11735 [Smithella sp.]|jgi:predicted GTPase